ncbi:MAG: helix-turn-helix domain-containing protein [Rhodopseudomonas palustris]|nr:helix-turn-helix domain-containing protein [Rhodopseudomonas palustris]
MARRLRDGGLPIAAIAEICNVERKTIYFLA